jgi:D-mannonate dehydratase
MEDQPKLTNIEIQEVLDKNTESLKLIEDNLKENLELFKEAMDLLEMDSGYLWHMNNSNEISDLISEEGRESNSNYTEQKYSREEIDKIKSRIEKMKKEADEINADIAQLTLYKIEINHYVYNFSVLNEIFRTTLLKIKPENLN